jgi:hypothetical protein
LPDHVTAGWPSAEGHELNRRVRRLGLRLAGQQLGTWSLRSTSAALVAGAVCRLVGLSFYPSLAIVIATALVPLLWHAWRLVRATTPVATAREVERRHGGFDNLLVTASEFSAGPRPTSALAEQVVGAALERMAVFDDASVADGRRPLLASVVLLILSVAIVAAPAGHVTQPSTSPAGVLTEAESSGITGMRLRVMPPDYIGQEAWEVTTPDRLEVPQGSRVAIHVASKAARVEVLEPDAPAQVFTDARRDRTASLIADVSTVWTVRALDRDGTVVDERLLPVAVIEDRAPTVRVVTPGGDQMFPDTARRVPVSVEAVDDHGLGRLVLRYTRVTGSGETFTFTEGEMPVRLDRRSAREWRGSAELDLTGLGLEVGDTLVYRAAARDRRPGAIDALSDSFLIEIGGVAGAASGGFTLPEDEHRHAISQQMVIIKTESLHAARAKMPPEEFLEESHHLSAEQRMVRAEFIFMTGGHVHDEVEEAEASHELAEGRFENEAMIEMIAAASHMSRAERHLIDGDTTQALVAERLALTSLQRAFDRRRYFLRTTPERSRIELDRRLSGSLDDARSWVREAPVEPNADTGLADLERVLALVDRAMMSTDVALTEVAAAVAGIEPGADDVQEAVALLGSAQDDAGRAEALASAVRLLRARAARWLAPAGDAPSGADPARGKLRHTLRPEGSR